MFKKYLGPYQYKYHSANYLSNFAVSGPENIANPYTDERKINVVIPISNTDFHIFTFKKANEIPTARASMLVAMASKGMVLFLKPFPLCHRRQKLHESCWNPTTTKV